MRDLIIDKIDIAIRKLRNAKMWVREQKEDEESFLGLAEDELNAAIGYIEGVFVGIELYEKSFNKNNP